MSRENDEIERENTSGREDAFEGEVVGESAQVDPPPKAMPRTDEHGDPVNQAKPGPVPGNGPLPAEHVARRAPEIFIPGNAQRPPGLLMGADMGDDRVCTINRETGRVQIFRRAASWRPEDGTSKFILVLIDEVRELRRRLGVPEFDN
jgi:hypothetical protein